MSLSYAFLHAGANQVISTLWSVDDAISRELMTEFYREFTKLMRTSATSAPYYWAGFTLTTAAAN